MMKPYDYQPLGPAGTGGEAEVVRARHLPSGRIVMLKLWNAPATPILLERLSREVELSRRQNHPGLVRLLECGMFGRRPCQVMEMVEGRSLEEVLHDAPLPVRQSVTLAHDLATTLALLHRDGVVHRDVKPGNIMIRPDGGAVLMDLGGAALSPEDMAPGADMVGTPAAMAPEIIADQPADGRADVFSLGVVLYRMLTGRRPFWGDPTELAAAIRTHHPPPPASVNAGTGPALNAVVMACLDKTPGRRPTAEQLQDQLAALRPQDHPGEIPAPR